MTAGDQRKGRGDSRIPVTVFVVHWNAPTQCRATIDAFTTQTRPTHVTVLDNGSQPDSLASIIERPGIEVISLGENLGFGPAANVGIRRWLAVDEGDWAVVAAHDALPDPDCLERLIEAAEDRTRAGIVSPEFGVFEIPEVNPVHGPRFRRVGPRPPGWESVSFPHGTLMLLRRACIDDVGVFDERYFAFGEEQDLGTRARVAGWDVGIVWGARVRNPGHLVPGRTASYLQIRNSLLYVRDHLGLGAILIRIVATSANTFVLLIHRRGRPSMYSFRARLAGIRDFVLGRFGPPPSTVAGG
jgi:N-acetylglucosaminyl-diphospho-decaprenol L-rhamnosyltransferase